MVRIPIIYQTKDVIIKLNCLFSTFKSEKVLYIKAIVNTKATKDEILPILDQKSGGENSLIYTGFFILFLYFFSRK